MKSASYCIRVRKRECDEVLRVVMSLGVLRRDLKIARNGEHIYIPVKDRGCLEDIRSRLPGVEIAVEYRDFEIKPKSSRDYRALLRGLLPRDLLPLVPRSYDIVGDIALVNLPPKLLDYGKYIGNAIMTVNKHVRAVYSVGATHGDFRIRDMIHLAGDEIYTTVHREYGIKLYVDLRNAYFNPSLSEERHRVALEVDNGDRVLDLFSGVGPFALHIACSKRAYVIANDINPYAVSCLRKSIELNIRRMLGRVDVVNSDAGELLNSLRPGFFNRLIMNLPLKSHVYVRAALSVLGEHGVAYVYTVASDDEEALSKIVSELGGHSTKVENVTRVIDYAPRRYIFRVKLVKIS